VYHAGVNKLRQLRGPMHVSKLLTPVVLVSLVGQVIPCLNSQEPAPPPTQTTEPAPPQTAVPTPTQAAAPAPIQAAAPQVAAPAATAPTALMLPEGTDVPLAFDQDLSSKTAAEGDEITFVLTDDIKVGDVVVAKAGCKAFGEVTNAKKSGMMGKAGELNIRLNYMKVGAVKVKLRGSKGKEGESGTTGAVVLTVLFGPIGLIKHGKNIEMKKGTAMKVYVSDDVTLPPSV